MSAIEERRQRAREAFADEYGGIIQDIDVAIETATRVRIDDGIVRIHRLAWLEAYNERLIPACDEHSSWNCPLHFNIIDVQKDALIITLKELGFEVEP